jgi:hypothetical protein
MKTALPLLIAALFTTTAFGQTTFQNGDADALIAKSRAVYDALKTKDVAGIKTLIADDFRIVSSEGKLHERGELLGTAQEGSVREVNFYNPQVIQIDSGAAVVTYNLIITMPEGDDLLAPRYQKISDLWVRQGSEWRLKFEQSTPLRPID